MDNISFKLNEFFDRHLPITDYLGMRVDAYDNQQLTLYAPLQPSLNDKLTAFGGSLYCVSVMTCWGMMYLKAIEAGYGDANMVVVQGNIRYLAPVNTDIRATCVAPTAETFAEFFAEFKRQGKAKITLNSTIEVDGQTAVVFEGQYAILKQS